AQARIAARVDGGGNRCVPGDRRTGREPDVMHNRWHPDLEPIASVAPGEEIPLGAEEGLAPQPTPEQTHSAAGQRNLGLGHPLSGPVHVEGAEPGQTIEVEFVSYES